MYDMAAEQGSHPEIVRCVLDFSKGRNPFQFIDLARAVERVLFTVGSQPKRHSFDVAEKAEMPYHPQANE